LSRRTCAGRARTGSVREFFQGVHDLAIHQAEIAAVERNVEVADGMKDPVEYGVTAAFEEAFLALVRTA